MELATKVKCKILQSNPSFVLRHDRLMRYYGLGVSKPLPQTQQPYLDKTRKQTYPTLDLGGYSFATTSPRDLCARCHPASLNGKILVQKRKQVQNPFTHISTTIHNPDSLNQFCQTVASMGHLLFENESGPKTHSTSTTNVIQDQQWPTQH